MHERQNTQKNLYKKYYLYRNVLITDRQLKLSTENFQIFQKSLLAVS